MVRGRRVSIHWRKKMMNAYQREVEKERLRQKKEQKELETKMMVCEMIDPLWATFDWDEGIYPLTPSSFDYTISEEERLARMLESAGEVSMRDLREQQRLINEFESKEQKT